MDYTLEGNAFFAAAYGVLLPPQIYLGVKYKTWGFLFGMFAGLLLEILAYVGRVQLHNGEPQFLMYIVTITIGPAFLSAAVYLCLARIIKVYGEHLSYFRPRTIAIVFMVLDFVALMLQSAGGATIGGDNLTPAEFDRALSILQAGLSVHLAGIILFAGQCSYFAFTVYSNQHRLAMATLCILIRTAYRVAELSEGLDSAIAMDETLFFILEGVMILLASILLTAFHPGPAFQKRWAEANFELKARRKKKDHTELESNPSPVASG
ncbi:hypothetical protein S40288_04692 [Stachybotrys chartarum IBT 40288]|nr:hypothetical protein S40288_04692 [Stachybotrys chartarum IBT 40288]